MLPRKGVDPKVHGVAARGEEVVNVSGALLQSRYTRELDIAITDLPYKI